MKKLLPLVALALIPVGQASPVQAQASARLVAGQNKPSPLAPGEIVAAAPKADWIAIAPADLLVMDLVPDAQGAERRVVIQLMPPPFSTGWTGNIRKLAAAHWWDGLSINRVQDNYVVQWGDGNAEDAAKAKPLPAGLASPPESEYVSPAGDLYERAEAAGRGHRGDAYAPGLYHRDGWPVGYDRTSQWPVHCYGMVGVGRDLSPNTGSGAELYVVIGHAPRHLDRNIALVGRVIEGIEHLSSLPRGTAGMGFYEKPEQRTGIKSIRLGEEVPGLPAYEYLSTESGSFARYADARANRRDAFFIRPAGGADICNVPVPVRRVP
ncbi:peptidylprolyl isomerase [Novosphingobium sp. NPDC080210]|uniref:peptidylprolyl isomerase n=1 Tax=Novosphingobium sp. NPDC080210 TaxID=3390596 RepID=UPI003CFD316E